MPNPSTRKNPLDYPAYVRGLRPSNPESLALWVEDELEKLQNSTQNLAVAADSKITSTVTSSVADAEARGSEAIEAEARARAQAILNEAFARGVAITTESNIRQDAEESLAEQITLITAGVADDAAAAILEERRARVDGDVAEATARDVLAAQMRGSYEGTDASQVTTGLVYSERVARAEADSAVAEDVTILSAKVEKQGQKFYVRAGGYDGNASNPAGSAGLFDAAGGAISLYNPMYTFAVRYPNGIWDVNTFNTLTDPNGIQNFINRLGDYVATPSTYGYPFVVYTSDEPSTNKSSALIAELQKHGAGPVFASAFAFRSAYILISTINSGVGAGRELYRGDTPATSYLSEVFTLIGNTLEKNSAGVAISAAVTTEAKARADGDAAEAQARQIVAARIETVNGNVAPAIAASVAIEAQARVEADGLIKANWSVEIDANGNVSGIKLMSDGSRSNFNVKADSFTVVNPGVSLDPVFEVTGGITRIKNAIIGTSNVSTTNIAPTAVSNTVAAAGTAYTTSTGGLTQPVALAFTTTGGAVRLDLSLRVQQNDSGSFVHRPQVSLLHVETGAYIILAMTCLSSFGGSYPATAFTVHTPSAGTNTYQMKFLNDGGVYYITGAQIIATEFKR